jgi:hypothetical protein
VGEKFVVVGVNSEAERRGEVGLDAVDRLLSLRTGDVHRLLDRHHDLDIALELGLGPGRPADDPGFISQPETEGGRPW